MIGPESQEGSGLGPEAPPGTPSEGVSPEPASPTPPQVQKETAVRWGIGCLVGAVALIGVLLLSALISFYLQPPAWVQVVLGVVLALGAVVLAWLVATAWGRSALSNETRATERQER